MSRAQEWLTALGPSVDDRILADQQKRISIANAARAGQLDQLRINDALTEQQKRAAITKAWLDADGDLAKFAELAAPIDMEISTRFRGLAEAKAKEQKQEQEKAAADKKTADEKAASQREAQHKAMLTRIANATPDEMDMAFNAERGGLQDLLSQGPQNPAGLGTQSEAATLGFPGTRAEFEQQHGPLQQFARYQLGEKAPAPQAKPGILGEIYTLYPKFDQLPPDQQLAKIREYVAAKTPAPTPTSFQEKQIVGPDGKPMFANFDPKTGKTYDPSTGKEISNPKPYVKPDASTTTSTTADIKAGSGDFRIAQDLAYGKTTFQQFKALFAYSRDPGRKLAIYNKAADLNPNFNPAAFEMGFKLASNPKVQQQLASLDNVNAAVPDLLALSDAAKRSSVPLINQFTVKGGLKLGNRNYSNFQTAVTAFADELSGALGYGSATDMSREMGFAMTDPSLSPQQFESAINDVVVPFLARKKDTLLNQMGVYGQPGFNPAAGPAGKVITEPLIQANLTAHPKATRQQIIDSLKAAGYQEK
jgi:hypothetical protein